MLEETDAAQLFVGHRLNVRWPVVTRQVVPGGKDAVSLIAAAQQVANYLGPLGHKQLFPPAVFLEFQRANKLYLVPANHRITIFMLQR